MESDALCTYLEEFHADAVFAIAELFRRGESVERLHAITKITDIFLSAIRNIVETEKELTDKPGFLSALKKAKSQKIQTFC